MMGFVKLRILEPDADYALRGDTLKRAMEADIEAGLTPFFVSTTLGTTSCVSFDPLTEIGPVCEAFNVWLHVDAAYAGSAFICPEFKYLMEGIEVSLRKSGFETSLKLLVFSMHQVSIRIQTSGSSSTLTVHYCGKSSILITVLSRA